MIIGRIIAVLIGYCFGMILMGYFIGKSRHIDLTKVGSGNVGSTNTMRNLGVPAGLITLSVLLHALLYGLHITDFLMMYISSWFMLVLVLF